MKTNLGCRTFKPAFPPPLPPLPWLTAVLAIAAPVFGLSASAAVRPSEKPLTYRVAEGRIEIKPRLKFELILSLHVLRCAEDHHQLFTNWAQEVRANLRPATLRQATNLNTLVHEWQLCSLVQNYDGPDTIEGITEYLRRDPNRECHRWAAPRKQLMSQLGVQPEQFGRWYADFLKRYYREGFGRTWEGGQRRIVQEQAPETVKLLEGLPYSILGFMEKHTGRKFQGSSKLILYPSSFSRPQHAYGFEENGSKVVVYKVSKEPAEALGSAFHELLHPLLHGWTSPPLIRQSIASLGTEPQFQKETQALRSSYPYPEGCLEEILVHALGNYLCVKAGIFNEATARRHGYGPYQGALYNAIFDRYEQFPAVDDFIQYALTHIQPAGSPEKPEWRYDPLAGTSAP